jgi:hypothetical protein
MDAVRMIGLWERKDKKGNPYLSDTPDGTSSIMVMFNTFKKESGDPDYFLYTKPLKKEKSEEPPEELPSEELPSEELPSKERTSFIRKAFKDFFENY